MMQQKSLEKINFNIVVNRKNTNCLKYDFAVRRGRPENVLPLWVADMDFKVAPEITQAIEKRVAHGIFGYSEVKEEYFEAVSAWMEQNQIHIEKSLDLACGTGVLCEILHAHGINASGMDFSEGMIAIARERNPKIHYDVADMITYRPDQKFDLVTCTGDALNHIMELSDIDRIFANVYNDLEDGGYFIFDILNEKEVPMEEPIDLDFSDTVKAQFMVTHDPDGRINLKTTVFENGIRQFEENIKEILHDEKAVCELLCKNGFRVEKCSNHFLENEGNYSKTWYVIARK